MLNEAAVGLISFSGRMFQQFSMSRLKKWNELRLRIMVQNIYIRHAYSSILKILDLLFQSIVVYSVDKKFRVQIPDQVAK